MTDSKLSDKQRVFVDNYLRTWNASEAARIADYAQPAVSGHENLQKPYIRAAIQERLAEHVMSADEALGRLSAVARGELAEPSTSELIRALELVAKAHGKFETRISVDLSAIKDIERELARISSVGGEKVDLPGMLQALLDTLRDVPNNAADWT